MWPACTRRVLNAPLRSVDLILHAVGPPSNVSEQKFLQSELLQDDDFVAL